MVYHGIWWALGAREVDSPICARPQYIFQSALSWTSEHAHTSSEIASARYQAASSAPSNTDRLLLPVEIHYLSNFCSSSSTLMQSSFRISCHLSGCADTKPAGFLPLLQYPVSVPEELGALTQSTRQCSCSIAPSTIHAPLIVHTPM